MLLHDGSFRPFVARIELELAIYFGYTRTFPIEGSVMHKDWRTFEMEEHIGLVVFEHLRDEFRIHVGEVDFLEVLVQHHDGFVEFFLGSISHCGFW